MEILKESFEHNQDARKTIQRLTFDVKRYQDKIKVFVDSNFVEILNYHGNTEFLVEEGEKLTREVDDVMQNTAMEAKSELYAASEELKTVLEDLEEIKVGCMCSQKLLKISELFDNLEAAKSENEYLLVMDLIGKLKTYLEDPTDKILPKLECFSKIKLKYHIENEMLIHDLTKQFEKLIQFNEKAFQNTKAIILKISKDKDELSDILVALFNVRYNPQNICIFLLESCFEPIITKPVSITENNEDPNFFSLTLSYSLKDLGSNLRPRYSMVLHNLEKLFLWLNHMNIEILENVNVFQKLSEHVKEQLLSMILKDCFEYAVPETIDEMENSTLVEDIKKFNSFLLEQQIISENDKELLNYSENIWNFFQVKFCKNVFESAVEIMHKDLHEMVSVGDKGLASASNLPFLFPQCMVSRTTLELINLMEKVLRQSTNTNENTHFLKTVSLIMNKYLTEVPSYHEKLLQEIPQETALFHNNCMFLAHWLSKNNECEKYQLIQTSLQTLGTEHFMSQVKNQKTQIASILKEFQISNATTSIDQEPKRRVLQSLRQLDLLKNVWLNILPEIVYDKTIKSLLNDLCSDLIKKIMILEDISTVVGNELSEIIGNVLERGPKLFTDPLQANKVKYWSKLNQLNTVLKSSLIQITELWCEGKGPLTQSFKAEEVKHLIRALFQNTDRRANSLATII
ncbi:ZW10 family protein [Megaselia abdita]